MYPYQFKVIKVKNIESNNNYEQRNEEDEKYMDNINNPQNTLDESLNNLNNET